MSDNQGTTAVVAHPRLQRGGVHDRKVTFFTPAWNSGGARPHHAALATAAYALRPPTRPRT